MQNKIELALSILLLPFRSTMFYQRDIFNKLGNIKGLEEDIWFHLDTDFKPHTIDEMVLLLKKYYPELYRKDKTVNIDTYLNILNKLSKSLISHRDGKLVYKYWKNENDNDIFGPYEETQKVQILNTISRMMPVDILAVNYLLENGMDEDQLDGFYSHITIADLQLEDILSKGVAENHIHAGAGFNFSMIWTNLMNYFVFKNKEYLKQLNRYSKYRGRVISNYIFSAMIMRLLMIVSLKLNIKIEDIGSNDSEIKDFMRAIFRDDQTIDDWVEKKKINSEDDIYLEIFERIWDEIWNEMGLSKSNEKEDFILDIWSEINSIDTYGENIFLMKSLAFIKKDDDGQSNSHYFNEIFMKYLRIKNNVFNLVVQNGTKVKGLDYFKKHYAHASWYGNRMAENEFWKKFFKNMFQDKFLKKLEIRMGIKTDLMAQIIKVLRAYKSVIDEDYDFEVDDFPRLGIVFHLLKENDEEPTEKCWKEYDKSKSNTYRNRYFGKLQMKYKKQIESLITLRNENLYMSEFIVGIDAASSENSTPIDVFSPIFDLARNSNTQKLVSIDEETGKSVKNKSLGFTFHAGEDFRHLISGIRRVDEVVEHCKFHAGDRIGHGTALGVDAVGWKNTNPVVTIPRGEYLDNLIWVWGIYSSEQNYDPKINLYLENQIYKFAKEIYIRMNGITISMLHEAYKLRFKCFEKMDLDNQNQMFTEENVINEDYIFCMNVEDKYKLIWNEIKLNHAHNCKCYLERIYEPIQVAVKDIDLEMALQVQSIICKRIAKKGIIVEINPTSNLVIGEIKDIFNHHAYIINNLSTDVENKIMLNINSDDPTVFNTNVSNEIAYLYYGLLHKNICREESLKWIDKLREHGLRTSFVSDKISGRRYYEMLSKIVNNYRN